MRKSEKYCVKCSRQWGNKLYNVVAKTKDSVVIMTKHSGGKIVQECRFSFAFVR